MTPPTLARPVAHPDSLRPLGAAWTAVLALAGVLAWTFGALTGRAEAFGTTAWGLVCAAPPALGILLACTSTQDRQQYVARGLAAAGMAPLLLAMWAGTPADSDVPHRAIIGTGAAWALGLGALLLHVVTWLALLAGTARVATRLRPPAGAPWVERELLRQRLAGLPGAGWPLRVAALAPTPGIPWEINLEVDDRGARGHRVRLLADEARRTVYVTEHLGAANAAPLPHEASFHRPGDPLADAGRPPVQRVSSRVKQATMIDAQAVDDMPLDWDVQGRPRAAALPPDWARRDADKRGEWGVALLAAAVLRSGWRWQPRLVSLPKPDAGSAPS